MCQTRGRSQIPDADVACFTFSPGYIPHNSSDHHASRAHNKSPIPVLYTNISRHHHSSLRGLHTDCWRGSRGSSEISAGGSWRRAAEGVGTGSSRSHVEHLQRFRIILCLISASSLGSCNWESQGLSVDSRVECLSRGSGRTGQDPSV